MDVDPKKIERIYLSNKSDPYGYVYITTNLVNGKMYVGQHKSVNYDPKYLGSGKLLKKAITKYGSENFVSEPICWAESKPELDKLEIYWVDILDAVASDQFYNLTCGGYGGDILSDDQKKEKSIRNSGSGNPRYGKHWDDEHRQHSKEIMTGRFVGELNPFYGKHHTNEYKNKKSETQKQYLLQHPEHVEKLAQSRIGISPSWKGEKLPEEWCENLRGPRPQIRGENNPNFNHKWSDEKRHQSSIRVSGENNPNCKPIVRLTLDYQLLESYKLIKDAISQGYTSYGIQNCLQGRSKKGYYKNCRWMYKKDYDELFGG